MKRFNFNIKDRKVLTLGLCLILVCVFTLTVAYAALNAVLTISGSAEVNSSTWDVYLANPRVSSGSVTSDVPVVKSKHSVEFSTTLNMPGDYYEFVIDVINGGTIDAVIENVVKTPELTAEQAKYINYIVSYENGEGINSRQILAKDSQMPIKVRVEYRRDISGTDLPTTQTVLDLALTLEYTQSDGSGTTVNNNGAIPISINGSYEDVGSIVTVGNEQFYVIGTEGSNVKLLAMYNLYVGNSVDENFIVTPLTSPTGLQSSDAKGMVGGKYPFIGTTPFSNIGASYAGSLVEGYVNNYKTLLESNYGLNVVEARLITLDEVTNDTFGCIDYDFCPEEYKWIYSTSYWLDSYEGDSLVYTMNSNGYLSGSGYSGDFYFGVRPVIVISKDYFN